MGNKLRYSTRFTYWMYMQPAPSGGDWLPEHNALTEWLVLFREARPRDPFGVFVWFSLVEEDMYVEWAFVWPDEQVTDWSNLSLRWKQQLEAYENL